MIRMYKIQMQCTPNLQLKTNVIRLINYTIRNFFI